MRATTARADEPAVDPGDASVALAGMQADERPPGTVDPVHGEVAPADVRAGDPITARLRIRGEDVAAQVWRISPLAVELVRTPALAALAVGDAADVTLRVGTSVATMRGARVVATPAERGRDLVALRWPQQPEAERRGGEKRAASRWTCGSDYVPTGVAPSAVRYSDHLRFRIVEISRSGMRLTTSLRNKFLVPGVSFEATCTFPTIGDARIEFRVVHARVARIDGKPVLVLGTRYAVKDARTLEQIALYLLQFGEGMTVQELRATGFEVRASSRVVDYACVRTDAEYREVLALRRTAYVHAKKASQDVKDVDMGDGFDAFSRILYARHAGRIVASVRLAFPRSATDPLKHEEYLDLPEALPPRDQLVEASKACTHPDYRGGDIFYRMMNLAALTTMQGGRRYILMSCTRALLPVYRKLGFYKVGGEYVHPTMKIAHQLLIGDAAAIVAGTRMNPVIWHLVDGPALWAFARSCGAARPSRWLDFRVAVYRLFKPIAVLVEPIYARRIAAKAGRR